MAGDYNSDGHIDLLDCFIGLDILTGSTRALNIGEDTRIDLLDVLTILEQQQ